MVQALVQLRVREPLLHRSGKAGLKPQAPVELLPNFPGWHWDMGSFFGGVRAPGRSSNLGSPDLLTQIGTKSSSSEGVPSTEDVRLYLQLNMGVHGLNRAGPGGFSKWWTRQSMQSKADTDHFRRPHFGHSFKP